MRYSIESSIEKGRELPEWYVNEPEIEPVDQFYLKAFWDLNTCRNIGMGMGPIPWRDILNYALFYELDDDLVEAFIDILREMDNAFLEQQVKEQKAQAKLNKNDAKRRQKR